jgi:hypothetical protein
MALPNGPQSPRAQTILNTMLASGPKSVMSVGIGYRLPDERIYRIFAVWQRPMRASTVENAVEVEPVGEFELKIVEVDRTARTFDGGAKIDRPLSHRNPARIAGDVVAKHHKDRDILGHRPRAKKGAARGHFRKDPCVLYNEL